MFSIGQEVMIIGDARCQIGSVSVIVDIMPCDMAEKGIQPLYKLASHPLIDGMTVLFQEHHLMSLNGKISITKNRLPSKCNKM